MCRLCGTNRPAFVPKQVYPSSRAQTFREIVRDYIGEFPCAACCVCNSYNKDIEAYIIDKLFIRATKGRRREAKNAAAEMSKTRKTVSHNIILTENLSTGHIAYLLTIKDKQFRIRKVFHDIDDAIKERDWRLKKIKEKKPPKKVIEKYIHFTPSKTFTVVIKTKGKTMVKTFKTLKEAQTFKALMIKKRDAIRKHLQP